MTDLVGEWQRTAAHAWRSYEMRGRGSLLLNNRPQPLNARWRITARVTTRGLSLSSRSTASLTLVRLRRVLAFGYVHPRGGQPHRRRGGSAEETKTPWRQRQEAQQACEQVAKRAL